MDDLSKTVLRFQNIQDMLLDIPEGWFFLVYIKNCVEYVVPPESIHTEATFRSTDTNNRMSHKEYSTTKTTEFNDIDSVKKLPKKRFCESSFEQLQNK